MYYFQTNFIMRVSQKMGFILIYKEPVMFDTGKYFVAYLIYSVMSLELFALYNCFESLLVSL